jgi:tetraacyldisaccharide 4'-kinase
MSLWNPTDFRDIVSGRRHDLAARCARGLLQLAEPPYTLATTLRNWRYDRNPAMAHRVGVPVISIGNLTLGGTGKTPLVKWLARWFQGRGIRVAIVSRGYGSKDATPNDEALELTAELPDVPHIQNPDRVAAAREAIEKFQCQVVLLDDGFQHRRLARDLDVVLVDALEPFGFDHVFPRGTLRESLAGLGRVDVVCLSRADMIGQEEREAIRSRVLARSRAGTAWCELAHAPSRLVNASGVEQPFETIRGKDVAAFCGIGNPAAFRRTLDAIGCQVVAWRSFADHHVYANDELRELEHWSAASGAAAILCTRKDLVKLRVDSLGGRPLWAVQIEMQFLRGDETFSERLNHAIASLPIPPG